MLNSAPSRAGVGPYALRRAAAESREPVGVTSGPPSRAGRVGRRSARATAGPLRDGRVGDRIPLPLGPAAGLDALDLDESVLQQARHGRVDLPVVQRAIVTEALVEG